MIRDDVLSANSRDRPYRGARVCLSVFLSAEVCVCEDTPTTQRYAHPLFRAVCACLYVFMCCVMVSIRNSGLVVYVCTFV